VEPGRPDIGSIVAIVAQPDDPTIHYPYVSLRPSRALR